MPENSAPTTTTNNSFIKTTAFNLTLNGSMASFQNFLKNLEASSRLLDVGQINFQAPSSEKVSAGKGDNENSGSDFVISVKTYSY